MRTTTYSTWSDLIYDGGRLAPTTWGENTTLAAAVAATLNYCPDAIVLRVGNDREMARGLAPGGLAA